MIERSVVRTGIALGLLWPALARAEEPLEDDADYGATAEVQAPPAEPTRREVTPAAVRETAGAQGDPLRAMDVQPGVARSPAGYGVIQIRGASGDDSLIAIEGARVPLLYHFGNLRGVVAPGLVQRLAYYPGNFAAKYGRATGGVVDVTLRDPSAQARGALELSLLDTSALVEAPWGTGGTAVAARRSHFDAVFAAAASSSFSSVVAAPVYWDYQTVTTQRIGDTRVRVLGYGAHDSVELVLSGAAAEDPSLRGTVGGAIGFHRGAVSVDGPLGRSVRQSSSLTVGTLSIDQRIGPDQRQDLRGIEVQARSEVEAALSDELDASAGIDLYAFSYSGTYHGPSVAGLEGDPNLNNPNGAARQVSLGVSDSLVSPALYTALAWQPAASLRVLPGLRVDGFGQQRSVTLDPRLGARWSIARDTVLKGGVGRFTRPPLFWQSLPAMGNPDLRPEWAVHTSVGVEQRFGTLLNLSVEGFYKRLEDRIVGTPSGVAPHFVNDGTGRIAGVDVAASLTPSADTRLDVAYTLSRSERRERNEAWRLFDQDQPHVLAVAGVQRLGRGWTASATFRYTSGSPETPVRGGLFDARTGIYLPVYGEVNSARAPAWHRLDLRVEKQWTFAAWKLSAFVELINAYGQENREGARYSYDYRRSEAVNGLPLFPNLGVRGEL